LNGYIDTTNVVSETGGPSTTPTLDIFQAYNLNGDGYADAQYDDLRLYDKELTASEVSSLESTGSI